MIDLFQSRRLDNIRCDYWHRKDEVGLNQQISTSDKPTGYFFAKPEGGIDSTSEDFGGVMRQPLTKARISTTDKVELLQKDDMVMYAGLIWRVDKVNSIPVVKTTLSTVKAVSKKTYIDLLRS